MKKTIEVFAEASNAAIVQLPERKFPGIVLQGDGLHILFGLVESALSKAMLLHADDLIGNLSELKDILGSYTAIYEDTLNKHNIDLPYYKDVK